jgi:proline iminopeptidase
MMIIKHKRGKIRQFSYRWFAGLIIIALFLTIPVQGEDWEHKLPNIETKSYIQSIDGVELYYRITGAGPDTIVIIHGGPGMSISYLEPDLEPLSEKYTLIFYDQRGAGRSTMTLDPSLLHIDRYIADLEAVRRHFGINRLNLLGHSWGATLGVLYLRAHPGNVSRLVMVSPGPVRIDPYDAMFFPRVTEWMDETQLAEFESLHKTFIEGKGDILAACREFTSIFKRGYFYDPFDLETFARMRGEICNAPEAALRNTWAVNALTLQSLGEFDWRNDYGDIDIPVLIITGVRDIFPVENFYEWEAALPNAKLFLLDRSGHYPHVEQPEKFFPRVEAFLDDKLYYYR